MNIYIMIIFSEISYRHKFICSHCPLIVQIQLKFTTFDMWYKTKKNYCCPVNMLEILRFAQNDKLF